MGVPNLYRDKRTGIIYYRKQKAGETERLSTGETSIEGAVAWKKRHESGETSGDAWSQPLAPLAAAWIKDLECCPERRDLLERQIGHSLTTLRLEVTGDLRDRGAIKARLGGLGLGRKTQFSAHQAPLKQLTRWLAAEDHLPRDPLQNWKKIDTSKEPKRPRRAFEAHEVALSLAVSAWVDEVRRRTTPSRPIYVALLVAGPRVGAFEQLTVAELERTERRLVLGDDEGNKHRGRAELDDTTFDELVKYVAQRKTGPLFLSAEGKAVAQSKLLKAWRECMDIALVVDLWPDSEPKEVYRAWEVARFLTKDRVPNKGGNPKHVEDTTREAREKHAEDIARIAEMLRPAFEQRRQGIDVHAFRMTHQSWAESRGVLPPAIDAQLGHSNTGADLLTSRVGRTHYRDLNLSMFEPRNSAKAVRGILDEAEATLRKDGYRGWGDLAKRAPKRRAGESDARPVSKVVSIEVTNGGAPECEGPETSRLPALQQMEVTGLEPVASTLRT